MTTLIPDVVDPKKPIYSKTLNVEWLLNSLRNNDKIYQNLHGNRAVKDVTFYDVSVGKGFLSVILRCTIHFIDSVSTMDVYHTVLKVPGLQSIEKTINKSGQNSEEKPKNRLEDERYAKLADRHNSECVFYNICAPLLDVPCPQIYKALEYKYGEKEGVLHMEDLTLRGRTISYFENINLTQVKCFIKHLAHMHYKILTTDPDLWRGKFLKNQDVMAGITDNINAMMKPLIQSNKREEAFAPFIQKLHKFYTNKEFSLYSSKQSYIDLGMAPVLVHGDMHAGNIMWAIDEEGNIQNDIAVFIDWQIMHEGSPMSDLARFLTHCCDGVVRRQAEIFVIEFYYESLTKEFSGKNVPYTLEKLKEAYNYCYLSQAFFAIAATQMLFRATANEIENDSIKNAYHDYGIQKALHLLEDAERLLSGEMKDVFEKYGA